MISAAGRTGSPRNRFRRFSDRLLTLLFPHKCFLCGAVLADSGWLCGGCGKKLPYTREGLCYRCGKRRGECICVSGDGGGSPLRITAPLYYSDGVEHGIHRYKYDGRSYYAEFLARLMAKKVSEQYLDAGIKFDFITYVPLSGKKRRQRGFSQTELLARGMSQYLGVPVSGAAIYHTGLGGTQMALGSREKREENAKISFAVHKGVRLDGKTVLLVDDVQTTGATLRACSVLLTARGAKRVYCVTAATTVSRGSQGRAGEQDTMGAKRGPRERRGNKPARAPACKKAPGGL